MHEITQGQSLHDACLGPIHYRPGRFTCRHDHAGDLCEHGLHEGDVGNEQHDCERHLDNILPMPPRQHSVHTAFVISALQLCSCSFAWHCSNDVVMCHLWNEISHGPVRCQRCCDPVERRQVPGPTSTISHNKEPTLASLRMRLETSLVGALDCEFAFSEAGSLFRERTCPRRKRRHRVRTCLREHTSSAPASRGRIST